jgi:hypothetical protein
MALPTQLKNRLDAIHGLITSSGNNFIIDKITISGTVYKIKFQRTIKEGKVSFNIQIIEK